MNNQFQYTPVNKHDAHGSHYHAGIESFANQGHHKSTEAEGNSIIKELRKEFYSTGDAPLKRICYRNCFKFDQRKYIDFCLQKSCNGAEFEEAAKFMGYLK